MVRHASEISADLEVAATSAVGRIVFSFSRLEFNLGLLLRNLAGGNDVDLVNPLVDRLPFKSKLDALSDLVAQIHTPDSLCAVEFREWHAHADRLRAKRNTFMHGRWGVLPSTGEIVNVAPGMPAKKSLKERRYSLAELIGEADQADAVSEGLARWKQKWGEALWPNSSLERPR
jgi:hypothetical protein